LDLLEEYIFLVEQGIHLLLLRLAAFLQ
jgi:hypothetical protein